jgi:tRNA nucleotidyltransferase (CCA-adding enzyme)
VDIILTHENADFDAIAGSFAASRLYPNAIPVLPERLNQNVARFLALYGGAFPFVRQADLKAQIVSHLIWVDTQRTNQFKEALANASIQIIDHHPDNW